MGPSLDAEPWALALRGTKPERRRNPMPRPALESAGLAGVVGKTGPTQAAVNHAFELIAAEAPTRGTNRECWAVGSRGLSEAFGNPASK